MNKALIGLSLVLSLGVSGTASAKPPITTRYVVSGDYANAGARAADDCGATQLMLNGFETLVRADGTKSKTRGVFVQYFAYDDCAGTSSEGSGLLELAENIDMRDATLAFSLEVTDYAWDVDPEGQPVRVPVGASTVSGTVVLVGFGRIERGSDVVTSHTTESVTVQRTSGASREAVATFDVAVNGTALSFNESFGVLGKAKEATLTITKR